MATLFINSLLSKWIVPASVNGTSPVSRNGTQVSLQEAIMLHADAKHPHPSWLTFLCSGYSVGLLILALLSNRIYHLPQRRQFRLEPMMRVALRMPALILLSRSILLVLTKYAYESEPTVFPAGLKLVLPEEYSRRTDASVMWSVFLSLGIACLVEAFVRALNQEMRAHPSVNLLSVSYLLHFHSTPASAPVLKPTPLVYLLIALTLSEVLALQLMDTFQLNIRLIVTGVFSVFGQGAMLLLLLRATSQDQDPIAISALLPALRHLTRLSELLFFAISISTVLLHALAQLVVEGRVTRDIFGRAARLPNLNDDFSIAVMLYGTACLETTYAIGMANEVTPITAHADPWIELAKGPPITRSDRIAADDNPVALHSSPNNRRKRYGLQFEIKDVRAAPPHTSDSSMMSRSRSLNREVLRYLYYLFMIGWSFVQRGGAAVGVRLPFLRQRASAPGWVGMGLRVFGIQPYGRDLHAMLARFRRIEDDLSDDDFVPASDDGQSDSEESEEEDEEEVSETQERAWARARSRSPSEHPEDLYSDLLNTSAELSQTDQDDINNILLSHLSSPARMTRQRYSQMVYSPVSAMAHSHPFASGGEMDATRMEQLETQMLCVVCRADVRRIICWPCRCLSLCETCKDTLASMPASADTCPTCRKTVNGFSRIFIP